MKQQTPKQKDNYETPVVQDIQPVTVAVVVGTSDTDNLDTGDDNGMDG